MLNKILTVFLILFSMQNVSAQENINPQNLTATRVNSEINRQNNCNIIYEKLTKYNCSGFLSVPLSALDKKDNAYCLRLFEIYMTRNCDSQARVIISEQPKNAGSILSNDNTNVNKDLSFDSQTCQRDKFSELVGQLISQVDLSTIPKPYRVICNTCPVTLDYSPTRLNIKLDETGKISEITCG